MARTPSEIGFVTRMRFNGSGGLPSTGNSSSQFTSGPLNSASMGSPRPFRTRPSKSVADFHCETVSGGDDFAVRADVDQFAQRHEQDVAVAKANDFSFEWSRRRGLRIRQISPIQASGTTALTTSPMTSFTRPRT